MPEGDTIHRAAAALARALTGRRISRFESGFAHLTRVDEDAPLAGRTIEAVWAEGKHLLMRFSGRDQALVLRTHMRMSGSWHIYRLGERWQRPPRDQRILIETEPVEGAETFVAVAFSVPVAELLDERALDRSPALSRLGPDLLAEDFDPTEARRRLRAKPDQPISEVPLDQSVAAGAGNVYRSEVLFLAGLDPARPASGVPDEVLDALFALTRKLMRANIRPAADGQIVTYRSLRRTTGRADPSERLWVYGRGGKPCRKCGTAIQYRKTGPGARGLYWCPHCQR